MRLSGRFGLPHSRRRRRLLRRRALVLRRHALARLLQAAHYRVMKLSLRKVGHCVASFIISPETLRLSRSPDAGRMWCLVQLAGHTKAEVGAMVDRLTPAQRSALMARIRGKDTVPELVVRRLVHRMGFRFRLHRRDLPGSPDVVFPSRKKAVFVHGCFWHGHRRCKKGRLPVTRVKYWTAKIQRNRTRDAKVRAALARRGWRTLIVWECETFDSRRLVEKLGAFLTASVDSVNCRDQR